jgi:hypothetical protein
MFRLFHTKIDWDYLIEDCSSKWVDGKDTNIFIPLNQKFYDCFLKFKTSPDKIDFVLIEIDSIPKPLNLSRLLYLINYTFTGRPTKVERIFFTETETHKFSPIGVQKKTEVICNPINYSNPELAELARIKKRYDDLANNNKSLDTIPEEDNTEHSSYEEQNNAYKEFSIIHKDFLENFNYVGTLMEYSQRRHIPILFKQKFTNTGLFTVYVIINNKKYSTKGNRTIKEAKQRCAFKACSVLGLL